MFFIGKEKLIGRALGVPLGIVFMCTLMCQNVKSFASVREEFVAVHISADPPQIIPRQNKNLLPLPRKNTAEHKINTPKSHQTKQKTEFVVKDVVPVNFVFDAPKPVNREPQITQISLPEQPIEEAKPKPSTSKQLGGELAIYCPTRPPPEYPSASRELGEEGVVSIKVTINTTGDIESAIIIHSSKFQRLDNAALKAVRRWHCNSPFHDDANTKAIAIQEFEFGFNH